MKKLIVSILAAALAVPAAFAQNDVQSAAQKALSASRFKGVQVQVENGIATLSGTVGVYSDNCHSDPLE